MQAVQWRILPGRSLANVTQQKSVSLIPIALVKRNSHVPMRAVLYRIPDAAEALQQLSVHSATAPADST